MKIPLAQDLWDGKPRDPICPSFCQFRLFCEEWHQKGVNQNFVSGAIERRADACWPWYQFMVETMKVRFDLDAKDMNADQVFELVVERMAMEEAS